MRADQLGTRAGDFSLGQVSSPLAWGEHTFPSHRRLFPGWSCNTNAERSCPARWNGADKSHFSRPQRAEWNRAEKNGTELSSKRAAKLQLQGQGRQSPGLPYSPPVPQLCCSTAKLHHNRAVPQTLCFIAELFALNLVFLPSPHPKVRTPIGTELAATTLIDSI